MAGFVTGKTLLLTWILCCTTRLGFVRQIRAPEGYLLNKAVGLVARKLVLDELTKGEYLLLRSPEDDDDDDGRVADAITLCRYRFRIRGR